MNVGACRQLAEQGLGFLCSQPCTLSAAVHGGHTILHCTGVLLRYIISALQLWRHDRAPALLTRSLDVEQNHSKWRLMLRNHLQQLLVRLHPAIGCRLDHLRVSRSTSADEIRLDVLLGAICRLAASPDACSICMTLCSGHLHQHLVRCDGLLQPRHCQHRDMAQAAVCKLLYKSRSVMPEYAVAERTMCEVQVVPASSS